MTLTAIGFVVALFLLLGAGSIVVTSLSGLASALRLPAFTAGVIIMSFATTSPELLVGIDAGLSGQPEISLGNVLGTSIVNLGLILGIVLIRTKGVRLASSIFRRDLLLAYATSFTILLLATDGLISRIDGIVLLLMFLLWLNHLIHERRALKDVWNQGPALWGCLGALGRFGLAVFVLVFAAKWTVDSGIDLATQLGIPAFLLGVIALAVGTSLPELVFSLRVPTEKTQFAIGDLVGATTVTSTLVLGVTAILAPITAPALSLLILTGTSLLAIAIVTLAPLTHDHGLLRRSTGWTLILIAVTFMIGQVIYGR